MPSDKRKNQTNNDNLCKHTFVILQPQQPHQNTPCHHSDTVRGEILWTKSSKREMSQMAIWATAIKIKTAAVSLICSQKPVDILSFTVVPWATKSTLSHPSSKRVGSQKYLSCQFNGEKIHIQKRAPVQNNGASNVGKEFCNFTHYITFFLFSAEGGWKKFVTMRHLRLPKVKTEKSVLPWQKRGDIPGETVQPNPWNSRERPDLMHLLSWQTCHSTVGYHRDLKHVRLGSGGQGGFRFGGIFLCGVFLWIFFVLFFEVEHLKWCAIQIGLNKNMTL